MFLVILNLYSNFHCMITYYYVLNMKYGCRSIHNGIHLSSFTYKTEDLVVILLLFWQQFKTLIFIKNHFSFTGGKESGQVYFTFGRTIRLRAYQPESESRAKIMWVIWRKGFFVELHSTRSCCVKAFVLFFISRNGVTFITVALEWSYVHVRSRHP